LQFDTWTDTINSVLRHREVGHADLSVPPRKTTFSVLAYINHIKGRSYVLLACSFPSNIFLCRLQHCVLISFVVVNGFVCMLHTYYITPGAIIWLFFWVRRLHYVITKVNHSFAGVTYVCMCLFIY
jgi:hypothetical protein